MSYSNSSAEDDSSRMLEVTTSPSQEELLPLLECPVCFDLPLPPIRTCYQGHIICAECCPKLSGCPLCQKPIGYGRNFFAEDFINKSTMLCKYREDGCRGSMSGAQMKRHIPECKFRPMKCQYCRRPVAFRELEHHLLKEHQISRWDINDEGVNILELEKQRRNGSAINYVTPEMNVISTDLLMKSLLAVTVISFFADQLMAAFYPDEYSG